MVPFYPGQKVVCVDPPDPVGLPGYALPQERVTYEVRDVKDFSRKIDARTIALRGCIGIRLVEIVNDPRQYETVSGPLVFELAFAASRFRPLVETDISIFEAMLAKPPALVRDLEDA